MLFQAQRLDDLAHTLQGWLARYPARPLENETVLVPSNGMAEWFKAETATSQGIFAGTRVELPARFAWRVYQQVLGPLAQASPRFDKAVLPWVLLATHAQWSSLPRVADQLRAAGLGADSRTPPRPDDQSAAPSAALWRWCRQVADLFDQYQLYRADWLQDWAAGRFIRRPGSAGSAAGGRTPVSDGAEGWALPEDLCWQAELWAWLVHHGASPFVPPQGEGANRGGNAGPDRLAGCGSRPAVHEACLAALRRSPPDDRWGLPARVVLFGTSALAPPHLELLLALSRHCAVLLAVPNPCHAQWIDLADGASQGHPLLAAWGRQVRDFIGLIEKADEDRARDTEQRMSRVDHDIPVATDSALSYLQSSIQVNTPLVDSCADAQIGAVPPLSDGSIQFVKAHTPLREVEVLQDHLLHRLTEPHNPTRPRPRDVVVMVPDLARYAPAIRSVFGGLGPEDPRHIPWGMADQVPAGDEGLSGLAVWLLSLPSQRCTAADLLRLLRLPGVAKQWELDEPSLDRLRSWIRDSGIRWGLSAEHRADLGFEAVGDSLSWRFGVDRMLAGYASGAGRFEDAIAHQPGSVGGAGVHMTRPAGLAGVGGLEARAVGQLAGILSRLEQWRRWAIEMHSPHEWAAGFRALMTALVQTTDASQAPEWSTIEDAWSAWLTATAQAGFDQAVSLEVVHAALEDHLQTPPARARFRANGVTFCTLMPLRAIPFRIVCLLGMNDGDYPRPNPAVAGDLMNDPSVARPGDRSRRLDDRQLMLDAVLSARDHLFISWVGHRASDNEPQPPSVLVGQLRDTLSAIWGPDSLDAITTAHPLHPYSRRYFEHGALAATHIHEWESDAVVPAAVAAPEQGPVAGPGEWDSHAIERWLRCPVTAFWRDRLGVRWQDPDDPPREDEPLALEGLDDWSVWSMAMDMLLQEPSALQQDSQQWARACWIQLCREGRLPLGAPSGIAKPLYWAELARLHQRVHAVVGCGTDGWLELSPSKFLRASSTETASSPSPTKVHEGRLDLLLMLWWIQTEAAEQGDDRPAVLITPDATVRAARPGPAAARESAHQVRACIDRWYRASAPMPATARLLKAWQGPAGQWDSAWEREAQRNAAWRRSFGEARDGVWQDRGSSAPWDTWPLAMDELYGPFWQWCQKSITIERA